MQENSSQEGSSVLEKNQAIHVFIEGRVQGVGFRYFVARNAEQLALKGWVCNRYNGEVEVWAEGPKENLYKLVNSLRQGPPSSVVTNLQVEWENPKGNILNFSVLQTR